MNPDELRAMIDDAVRKAVQPLEQELNALRFEIDALKNPSGTALRTQGNTVQDAVVSRVETETQPPSPVIAMPEVNTEIPAERTDFARFLQRGLEQEAHDYSEEHEREDEPKKRGGWNPFKR